MAQKLTFEEWMKKVDSIIEARTGMTHMDLPDWSYAQAHEDGVTALSAASRAIKAARDF